MCDESIELHYIYIKGYMGLIKEQNINIINEYSFNFEKNRLTQVYNPNFIKNMYGFTKSINVVVGKNGSGKTSVFSFIIEIIASSNYNNDYQYLVVTKEKGKFYCYASKNYEGIEIDKTFFETLKTFDGTSLMYFNDLFNISNYYTGVFSNALHLSAYSNISNEIAKMGLEKHKTFSYTTKSIIQFNDYSKFNQEQNYMNLNFLLFEDDDILKNIINFPLSEYLSIGLDKYIDIMLEKINKDKIKIKYLDHDMFYRDIYENHLKTLDLADDECFDYGNETNLFIRFDILQRLFFDFVLYMDKNLNGDEIKCVETLISLIDFPIHAKHVITCYDDIYNQLSVNIKEKLPDSDELLKKVDSLICISSILKENTYLYNDAYKPLDTPYSAINININELKQLYKAYKSYSPITDFLKIYWDRISSGENALLNIYARIFDFYEIIKDKNSAAIFLFFDEIELYMHPEWQRKVIYVLLNYCNEKFKSVCHNLQLFFATNSPFSLSDIISSNIIYLDNKDSITDISRRRTQLSMKNTFGQNIHTLLKDNFFMDYTIGEFSRNYINDIIEALTPDRVNNNLLKYPDIALVTERFTNKKIAITNWDDVDRRICIIGDTLIRDKLFDMLYMCRFGAKNEEDYLKRLKAKRERIEKEIESFNNEAGDKNDTD